MITLAIEQSTGNCSAVLMKDADIISTRHWAEERFRSQQMFKELPVLFSDAGIKPESIDLFAVGLGPGTFAALRISITTLRAMALPGNKPVIGISSAEALAADIAKETGKCHVSVIGDARRERLWLADFEFGEMPSAANSNMRLVSRDQLAQSLRQPSVVATPDWDRVKELLEPLNSMATRIVSGRRTPRAETIARLAVDRMKRNLKLDDPVPKYLHAPVR